MRRFVDDIEEPRIDRITLRQKLVEIHAAHHGTDVRHDEVEDCDFQIGDFIGGLRRVEHLIEDDAVDRYHRIVARDDLLARYVEHLLHHVHLGPDIVDEGRDDAEAGHQAVRVAPEPFDRIDMALRHDLDRPGNEDDRQKQNGDDECRSGEHGVSSRSADGSKSISTGLPRGKISPEPRRRRFQPCRI